MYFEVEVSLDGVVDLQGADMVILIPLEAMDMDIMDKMTYQHWDIREISLMTGKIKSHCNG